MRSAHVLVVMPDSEPFWKVLDETSTTIGSGSAATVRLSDLSTNAIHAEIERQDHGYILTRLGDPVWVNGQQVAAQPLQDGDLITLGRTAISFRELGPSGSAANDGKADADQALRVLRRLCSFSRQLYDGEAVSDAVDQGLNDVVELVQADRGMLVLFGSDESTRFEVTHTARAGQFDSEQLQLSHTAIAKMREDTRPHLWTDIAGDPDLSLAPSIHQARVRSLMAVPVIVGEAIVGALYLSRSVAGGCFTQHHLDLVAVYAAQIAILVAAAGRDRELADQVAQMKRELDVVRSEHIWGSSQSIQDTVVQLRRVAVSTVSVLIIGETGTGKELFSRELHRVSPRASGPFVAVNCGAIPHELIESELFGHVRGAFTGATADRLGRLRQAAGGTLFLDEIGELPLEQQAKLLRVLEDRQVTPVGGDKSYNVDFRLVCATNRNLEQQVHNGRFRTDLYYRVAGFELYIPALRDRDDDAVELARLFVKRHGLLLERPELNLSVAAVTAIRHHGWPGNVRELEAAIQRAMLTADGALIQPGDLGLRQTDETESVGMKPLTQARDDFLRNYVQRALKQCGGNRTAAARLLHVTPRTVFKYLEEV